jgi:2-keto-3-deoxy-L-rhamnonate aldolase RhmA
MTRLLEDAKAGRVCLGTLIQDGGTFAISSLAKAGFSYVFFDFMFGTLDWKDVRHMTTAARLANMTSLVRIQNYPWVGDGGVPDGRLAADAARVVALGADGVRCSVTNAADVRRIAAIANDWHRVPSLMTTPEELAEQEAAVKDELIIMPIIESVPAWEDLDEIMSIDAVNAVMMSGTDLPRQLYGLKFGYEHPDVWKFLDEAVALGRKHDVVVGFNTGYTFTGVTETVERIQRLREHGVNFILVQTLDHMIYSYGSSIMAGL